MAKKTEKDFEHFYNLMMSHKIAYDIKPSTLCRAEIIWKKSIAPFWRTKKPSEIDQDLIVEFINWHKEHRKGVQLVNVFKYLGNIMGVMVESGALKRKPELILPKDEQNHHAKQKGRYITDEEFLSILDQTSGWFELFLLISYCVGMRKMEIGKMEVSRVHKVKKIYIFELNPNDTKTGQARKVPLPEFLTEKIDLQLKNSTNYLFPSQDKSNHITPQAIDEQWKRAKHHAGITGRLRYHDLRHVCASNFAKSGINPVIATTILGMSLTMFQKKYLKLTPEDLMIAAESSALRINKK